MINNETIEKTKAKVRADYQALLGRLISVHSFTAYVGDTDVQEEVNLQLPVLMKVCETADSELTRICDDWMDPTYELVCVELEVRPELKKYRSIDCYGHSYNMRTRQVEPASFIVLALPPIGIDYASGPSTTHSAIASRQSDGSINFAQIAGGACRKVGPPMREEIEVAIAELQLKATSLTQYYLFNFLQANVDQIVESTEGISDG